MTTTKEPALTWTKAELRAINQGYAALRKLLESQPTSTALYMLDSAIAAEAKERVTGLHVRALTCKFFLHGIDDFDRPARALYGWRTSAQLLFIVGASLADNNGRSYPLLDLAPIRAAVTAHDVAFGRYLDRSRNSRLSQPAPTVRPVPWEG